MNAYRLNTTAIVRLYMEGWRRLTGKKAVTVNIAVDPANRRAVTFVIGQTTAYGDTVSMGR